MGWGMHLWGEGECGMISTWQVLTRLQQEACSLWAVPTVELTVTAVLVAINSLLPTTNTR